MADRRSRLALTTRLLLVYAMAVVAALAVLAIAVDETVRRTTLAWTIAAFTLGGIVVFAMGRRLSVPLLDLADAAGRIADGEFDAPIQLAGPAELSELGHAINALRDRIGERFEAADTERQMHDAVLASMENGILLVGPGDSIRYANSAAEQVLGGIASTLREITPTSLVPIVEDARAGEAVVRRDIETGLPLRALHVTASRVGADVMLEIQDVTATRRLASVRRDFVADASHELKTPIASIRSSAETLQRAVGRDPEAAAKFAGHIETQATRLARIVEDLLDLSRMESEEMVAVDLDLSEVVFEETRALQAAADAGEVVLKVVTDGALVRGSRKDLASAIRNLVDNAIRYTPAGGGVQVEVGEYEEHVVVRVSDTGRGIPTRDLPRIFERFYRVDADRSRESGGTGLGLAIVKHVAERHGGFVEVESRLGKGSTFVMHLPRPVAGQLRSEP
ncbi:MAG: HAMP domain-containing protein [Acidimicrobiia bacterium]|nr:HAMP domain-containing protein [Acidimicrobiia bacterium]NNL28252.1 HAMP domain-containing protein [Acidimicrobiia bacterium]